MDLLLLEINVVDGKAEDLADPHACPQKQKYKGAVSGVVYHFNEPFYVLGVHRPRELVGKLQSDRLLQDGWREYVLLHKEVKESNDGGHPGLHRCYVHAPALLTLNKGLEVGALELRNVAFA